MSITLAPAIEELIKDQKGQLRWKVKHHEGQTQIFDKDRHVSAMRTEEWQSDGREMLKSWEDGRAFDPRKEFAGRRMNHDERKAARLELLERGADATREVGDWPRYLAASEAKEGGLLGEALNAVEAEQWPAVVRELFDSLFTAEPKALEESAAGTEWIGELMTQTEAKPEWSQLRDQVRGDHWAAGVAAGRVARSLAGRAQEMLDQLPKQDPQRLEEDANATEELLGPEAPATATAKERAREAAGKAQRVAALFANSDAVGQLMAEAADEAKAEVAAALAGVGDLAGLSTGALTSAKAPPEAMRKLLLGNPNLRKLVQLAGRLRIRARSKQRTKTKYVPESIVDVTLGGEISRLLPSELAQLMMPETELHLMRKIQEREALQYELEGEETLERGPVVVAVDSSGSMSGIRNQWAMAVAIAVLEIAAMQRRPFVLMHFDAKVQATFEVLKPSALSLDKLIEMVSFFSGGGTDFAAPLQAAHEQITRNGKGGVFARADVMLVTDGMARWGDWAQRVKSTGASLYGVAIECAFSEAMAAELTGCIQVSQSQMADASANVDLLFGI